jgi:hypothetical protein
VGIGMKWLTIRSKDRICEYGNETSDSIKGWDFFDQLSNY